MIDIGICCELSAAQLALIRAKASGFQVDVLTPDLPCESAILFGNPEPEAIATNSNLRWLQLESVGFGEYLDLDWMRPGGKAVVTNLAGFFAEPVAESALAGILALYRGIDDLVRYQSKAQWVGDPLRTKLKLLRNAKVVLVGFGAINARLAQMLAPFDCRISAVTSATSKEPLDAALADADLVVCTAPATAATQGLFDAARLSRLPQGALFCNFGRGSIVDDEALADLLETGRLAGAVIDVTREEPLPSGHRFWTCPNMILTQHSGGGTQDEMDRKVDLFLANLARFRIGAPLDGVVDFSRGY